MFRELNLYFKKICPLTDSETEFINKSFSCSDVPRKTILLRQGEICQFEAFVVKGCLKSYYLDEAGHEIILTFPVENWWVSDIASFNEQKPGKLFIETIEDSRLLMINRETKEQLLAKIPKLERVFRLMVQKHLSVYQERLYNNVALPAEERYHIFLERYPGIPQRVPQHLIASYLGISPEFLSRIRARKSKK